MPNPTYRDGEGKTFLQRARDRFKYCYDSWREIKEEHDKDMRFLAGDSWDPAEKSRRKNLNMPMVHFDELTQYINQLVNDVRQNKRAVNVLPKGNGASNQTAALRADWVRAVEYISQAQTAYTTAFQSAAGSSYGFFKLETFYESEKSWDMGVRICEIVNANTIVYDPDCKKYDCSDAEDCWELDFMSHDAFRRKYPDAEVTSFADDDVQQAAPEWVKPKQVQVASWWKVELDKVKLHLVQLSDSSTKVMRSDELPKDLPKEKLLKSRDFEDRRIVQYVLNGVEVLETNDPKKGKGWPGQWIPIIPVWGKEMFVDEGSGAVRKIYSLIRLARDPQRYLNYLASQELAEAKMTPRSPYMGPRGMFSANWKDWEDLNEDPKAAIEYDIPEGQPPGTKPDRVPFEPNFQAYEMAKQAASRAIMTAMGISPLPTDAQKANNKSGIALAKIQGERAQGSFHFIDNFDRSLVYCGRQLDDIFEKIHTMARDIPQRKEDGTQSTARINDPDNGKNKMFEGDHDVTITVGPSNESQREAVAEFADTLANIQGVFPLIGDLIVKMRNLGPIGEQIAERLTPPQFAGQGDDDSMPPQAKAAIGQLKQQLQQLQTVIQQLTSEKAAKMWELDGKTQIEKIKSDTAIAVAQIQTKAQQLSERLQALEDIKSDFMQMAHEKGMSAQDHQQATAQSAQEHQQALEQGTQQAALAPQPDSGNNAGAGQ